MSSNPITASANGKVIATGELLRLQAGVFGLRAKLEGEGALAALLDPAMASFRRASGKKLHFRLASQSPDPSAAEALLSCGFRRMNERVEFRAELADLPGDAGTPFRWAALADKSEGSLRYAALVLERAGEGDPDWGADDDAYELLEGYLADPVLHGGSECVAIGSIAGEEAAIVVAQANPKSGWSRLTYLGLLPEFRGRGLGKWVHRHGFEMLRVQGGKLYHGGTLATNAPMQKLFRRHGCAEFQRLEEWVYG